MTRSAFKVLLVCLMGNAMNVDANTSSDTTGREVVLYDSIDWRDRAPDYEVFYSALKGYEAIQDSLHLFNKPLLTIIDFSKPSSYKRLWVVNLDTKRVLFNTYVAHGSNSGDVVPRRFSNQPESFQSSLGFYKTAATYIGKHGLSLKLLGLEEGINDKAEKRSIVIHGAEYVSDGFIKNYGRLGRSQGCPAVPVAVHRQLIEEIKDQTCLYIYYPEKEYFQKSQFFKDQDREQYLTFSSIMTGKKS
jgi:hypothetical protein